MPACPATITRSERGSVLESLRAKGDTAADPAPVYPRVLDELVPAALHVLEQHATTASSPTTLDSKPGFGRCALKQIGSARTNAAGTHSCRTSAVDTTNSRPTMRPATDPQHRSPNSHPAAEPSAETTPPPCLRFDRSMQERRCWSNAAS
jgi:hypothetical protein